MLIHDPANPGDRECLRRRRYGRIEMIGGRLHCIALRPWPKIPMWAEARLWGKWRHGRQAGDVCRLYYNEPRSGDRFLTLAYVESSRDGTLASFRGALQVLDQIARIKGSDFLVTAVANVRISERLLARWGWEPLAPRRWHRLYVKRFYERGAMQAEPLRALQPAQTEKSKFPSISADPA